MTLSLLRRGILAALALAGTTAGVRAQSRPVADPASVPELKAEFDRAAKLGLDANVLVAKARQGYLTSASTGKVRDAVRSLTDRMVAAREALSPVVADGELVAGASVIQHGVPTSVLRDLRAAERSRSLVVPLGVLENLVEVRGVSVKDATATVMKLVKNKIPDTQVALLGRNVQGDVAMGLAPSVAMEVRLKGVLSLPLGPAQGAAVAPNRPPPR